MSVPCSVVMKGRCRPRDGEHLAREQCADRVRNGVVHVQEIE